MGCADPATSDTPKLISNTSSRPQPSTWCDWLHDLQAASCQNSNTSVDCRDPVCFHLIEFASSIKLAEEPTPEHHNHPKAGNGRRPVGVERMRGIYFLEQWFNLSDPAVEEALYESASMRQFAGIDLGQEPVPMRTPLPVPSPAEEASVGRHHARHGQRSPGRARHQD